MPAVKRIIICTIVYDELRWFAGSRKHSELHNALCHRSGTFSILTLAAYSDYDDDEVTAQAAGFSFIGSGTFQSELVLGRTDKSSHPFCHNADTGP